MALKAGMWLKHAGGSAFQELYYTYTWNAVSMEKITDTIDDVRLGHLLIWYYRWQDSDINDITTFYTLSSKEWDNLKCRTILENDLKDMVYTCLKRRIMEYCKCLLDVIKGCLSHMCKNALA